MKIVVTIEVVEETVEVKKKNGTTPKVSNYARFFDDGCAGWSKDPGANLAFIKMQEEYANMLLKHGGRLYLNEVYTLLGLPKSEVGQVVGWAYRDGARVDFDIYGDHNRDFINGYSNTALLDFNVDGNIIGGA